MVDALTNPWIDLIHLCQRDKTNDLVLDENQANRLSVTWSMSV
jgi:hypothetical protein